ncbi:MAG: hypothetical protein GXX82_05965 [Syntrophorhabdus sp.]|nr:hypothetical protein [Syntrophorhabdus sp.]
MARTPRVTDEQVEASKEIYRIAREEADIEITKLRAEMEARGNQREAMGILKKIRHDRAHNDLIEAVVLYRVKENKGYKDGGLTWAQFCESVGYEVRTADNIINDLRPLFNSFSANVSDFLGISFNKIRYLGKAISADFAEISDGALVIEGEKIPLTPEHKDEIEAAIDKLQEDLKKQKEDFAAQKKAHERVQADTHKTLTKLEKELARHKGFLEDRDLNDEDAAFVKKVSLLKTAFDGYLLTLDPENIEELQIGKEPSVRMRAEYLTALSYMKMQILTIYEMAEGMYGDCIMIPEKMPAFGAAKGSQGEAE